MNDESQQDAALEVLLGSDSPDELPDWTSALQHVPRLTERECNVFELLADGASNRDISTALLIAERTVKKHVGSIITKLELDSRLQVGLVALTRRMVEATSRGPENLSATASEVEPEGLREPAMGVARTPASATRMR